MARPLAPLALTMGEPGGVGAEIAIKAWNALRGQGLSFFLIDDPLRLEAMGAPVARLSSPLDAVSHFPSALPVLPLPQRVEARFGEAAPRSAEAVTASIEKAVDAALCGEASAVVTNPIHKAALQAAGFAFPGHTEYLAALTEKARMPGGRRRGPVMMLAATDLRTVPLTVHIPLRDVPMALTVDVIVEKALVVAEALNWDFGVAAPRLAIAGLNPHAGEGGAIGAEERDFIVPAVARLRTEHGIDATGPLPADTMFHAAARARYDAALCMYHDQALIPIKTLAFFDAVNVTLGLPIIRTSPDHGTALDIAGKGLADPSSLIAALHLAADLAARRLRS
jgi:4-hydroxythreonine-4-phosphate dehydrogenase